MVAKFNFYLNMKMLVGMPKVANCLKCLKLMYSIDFNK